MVLVNKLTTVFLLTAELPSDFDVEDYSLPKYFVLADSCGLRYANILLNK